jgi:Dihydroprymidine dehydrogenase domain II, 4Fe-4S cluster
MRDLTPLPDLANDTDFTGPARTRHPAYVDLLPPSNAGCPAGENIQAWLAAARDQDYERAWRLLIEDNPFPSICGRVCCHPCENASNRKELDTPVSVHAVAKFASAGKRVPKKDLALQAIAHGNVYVARVAMGADPRQTLLALREAESYEGPSLVIAYSHCIAHGIEKEGQPLRNGMDQQYRAVASGYWPLIRYDPDAASPGGDPRSPPKGALLLDSLRPRLPLGEYMRNELRFRALARTDPQAAERLARLAADEVAQRWTTYEEMARGATDGTTDEIPGPGAT